MRLCGTSPRIGMEPIACNEPGNIHMDLNGSMDIPSSGGWDIHILDINIVYTCCVLFPASNGLDCQRAYRIRAWSESSNGRMVTWYPATRIKLLYSLKMFEDIVFLLLIVCLLGRTRYSTWTFGLPWGHIESPLPATGSVCRWAGLNWELPIILDRLSHSSYWMNPPPGRNCEAIFHLGKCWHSVQFLLDWTIDSALLLSWKGYGGFLQWGYPKMDGLQWNILWKRMIWGYSHFRKPPYVDGWWVNFSGPVNQIETPRLKHFQHLSSRASPRARIDIMQPASRCAWLAWSPDPKMEHLEIFGEIGTKFALYFLHLLASSCIFWKVEGHTTESATVLCRVHTGMACWTG